MIWSAWLSVALATSAERSSRAAGGVGDLERGCLHTTHHLRQLLNHVVEGIGEHTQRIGCDLRLHAQVAIANRADLGQQFLDLLLQQHGLWRLCERRHGRRWAEARHQAWRSPRR